MVAARSRDELMRFLDYVRSKGLMSPATVESRKASANKVLSVLNDEEAHDVTSIDLDDVVTRFGNLHGKGYTPDSLRTYRSRTKSAIDDFTRYLENPLAFRPGVQKRERRPANNGARDNSVHGLKAESLATSPPDLGRPTLAPAAASSILPIPLRADLTVHIQGLPFDLTKSEAEKIANVVKAMAMT